MKVHTDEITPQPSLGIKRRREFSDVHRKPLVPRNTPITTPFKKFGKKGASTNDATRTNAFPSEQQTINHRLKSAKNSSMVQMKPTPQLAARVPSMLLRLQARDETSSTLLRQPALRVPIKVKTSPSSKETPDALSKKSVEIETSSFADNSSLQVSFGRNTALRLEGEYDLESEFSFSSCLASENGSAHDVSILKNSIECSFATCLAVEDTAGYRDTSIVEIPKPTQDCTPSNAQYISSVRHGGVMMDLSPLFSPSLIRVTAAKTKSKIEIPSEKTLEEPKLSEDCTPPNEQYISSISHGGIMMDLSPLFSPSPTRLTSAKTKNETEIPSEKAIEEEYPLGPTLSLTNFQESAWLDFGDEKKNAVGKTRVMHFVLSAVHETSGINIIDGDRYHVEVGRMPTKKGISLHLYEEGMNIAKLSLAESISTIDVVKGELKHCIVSWTPVEAGGVREAIHLKLPRGRLRITVHGHARDLRSKKSGSKKKAPDSSRMSIEANSGKGASSKYRIPPKVDYATPLSKNLPSSMLPIHLVTLPLKETPLVCDAVWAETQCDAFAKWMNYTLKPTEENSHENDFQKYAELGCSSDRVALRSLLLHRRQSHARRKAQELYNSAKMRSIRVAVKSAVDKGHLAIREDKDMHADLGSRDTALTLLLSYSSPWLQLGLETVFDEIIDFDSHSFLARLSSKTHSEKHEKAYVKLLAFRRKILLKQFVVERVLSDPAIKAKYTAGRCKVPSGVFEKRYTAELRAHSLLHILLLVAFLDSCKKENMLDSVPRLFTKAASVKSSCAVLVSFCRDFMFGEANIVKHLSRLGLDVTYEQKMIDEYDFGVTNIASDIRDGVRLARLVEILQGDAARSLTEKMRLPTVSRLQKLHNVDIALRALSETSAMAIGNIRAKHIVDAHRDKVLLLLWSIVAHFKLSELLDADVLQREISSVLRANNKTTREHPTILGSMEKQQSSYLVSLLLQWCQVVCLQFGVNVQNFTSSFADGKALCYLIHYYHPEILLVDDIRPTSHDLQLKYDLHSLPESARLPFKKVFENERFNSSLANLCIEELGGIPPMLPAMDSCNIPEEKCVITALSYIFCRLIESSKEVRAARSIQEAFRRLKNDVRYEQKKRATLIILKFWLTHKAEYLASVRRKYGPSIKVVERFFLAYLGKAREMREIRNESESRVSAAATKIQRAARSKLAHSYFMVLQFCIIEVQRVWRAYRAQINFHSALYWCTMLQSFCRTVICRRRFVHVRSRVVAFQIVYRERHAAKCIIQEHATIIRHRRAECISMRQLASATLIQQIWRRFDCRIFYIIHMTASILMQVAMRRIIAMRHYSVLRQGMKKLQSKIRGFLVRETMYLSYISSCDIQKAWRGFHIRSNLFMLSVGVISLQALYRRRLAHCFSQERVFALKKLLEAKKCLLIQYAWRGYLARGNYVRVLVESIICQATIRRYIAAQEYTTMRRGFVKLQAGLRGLLVRNATNFANKSICYFQRLWRGFHVRFSLKTFSSSVVSLQVVVRRRQAQCARQERIVSLNQLLEAEKCQLDICTLEIQGAWRGSAARGKYALFIVGSIICQATIRRFIAAQDYTAMRRGFVKLQAGLRGLLVRNANNFANKSICYFQSLWRGFYIRFSLKTFSSSVVALQAVFRRRQAQYALQERIVSLNQLLEAEKCQLDICALEIQGAWRGSAARSKYMLFVIGSIICQATIRRYIAAQDYTAMRRGFVKLQAGLRGLLVRNATKFAHMSICYFQSLWRGFHIRFSLKTFSSSVVSLQVVVRRRQAQYAFQERIVSINQLLEAEKCKLDSCALEIQRASRGSVARCKYTLFMIGSIIVQTTFRRLLIARNYSKLRRGMVMLQSRTRGLLVQNANSLAHFLSCDIQRVWRGYHLRFTMSTFADIIISLQSAFRRRQALEVMAFLKQLQEVEKLKTETFSLNIQCIWRGYIARSHYITHLVSSIIIQTSYRRIIAVNVYLAIIQNIFCVQRHVRGYLVRKRRMVTGCASLDLQRLWRGHKCRISYTLQNSVARDVQRVWRGTRSQFQFIVSLLSTIELQTWFRSAYHQNSYINGKKCVLQLQDSVRLFIKYKMFLKKDVASRCLQRFWRYQAHSRFQERLRAAAHKILHWLKVRFAIAKHKESRMACIIIQRAVRQMQSRLCLNKNMASCEIQRMWRGYKMQVDYIIMILAAILIQTKIQECLGYKKRQLQVNSVIKMQAVIRVYITRDRFKSHMAHISFEQFALQKAISKMQEAFRLALFQKKVVQNVCMLQSSVRVILARVCLIKARRLALFLQARLRGNKVRKKSSKTVKLLTRKLRLATQRALKEPQMQLGFRTSRALHILQTSKRMAELMGAIETLEISTRLSRSCCKAFSDAGAPSILYDLIRTCNRSLPHIELLQLILATLENVSVYSTLLPSLATDDSVDILIDLIQMFRDKEIVLWFSAHLLLKILRHNDIFLINCAASNENMRRLKGVYSISQKKAALGVNFTSNRHCVQKARKFKEINMKNGIQLLGKIISSCRDFV